MAIGRETHRFIRLSVNVIQSFEGLITMMLGRYLVFSLVAFVIGLIALYVYLQYRVPDGIVPQSDNANTVAWVSLATAVVSLLTATVSLLKALIEMRKKPI